MARYIVKLLVVGIFGVVFTGASTAYAAVSVDGTYTWWSWPTVPDGYSVFEWSVTPEQEAPGANGVFWAHQFRTQYGEGGYFGIQNRGSDPTGKIAIFSLWDALDATSPEYAKPFTGEGTGYSVRIRYNWVEGRTYVLKVYLDYSDASGNWWTATIQDAATGAVATVGSIKVPSSWGRLTDWSVMWTEEYIGLESCSELYPTRVRFGTPRADGGVLPLSHRNVLASENNPTKAYCPGSSVIDVPDGVRHWIGVLAASEGQAFPESQTVPESQSVPIPPQELQPSGENQAPARSSEQQGNATATEPVGAGGNSSDLLNVGGGAAQESEAALVATTEDENALLESKSGNPTTHTVLRAAVLSALIVIAAVAAFIAIYSLLVL